MSLIPLPDTLVPFLGTYLPQNVGRTFVTLTYAQLLDSRIAAEVGVQTKISHLETKTMTHYLRSKHDAIMVGIGTVLADDPKLNCRFEGGKSPIPVILDPTARWKYSESQLRQVCDNNEGVAPIILIDESQSPRKEDQDVVNAQGGQYVKLDLIANRKDNWKLILSTLFKLGVKSVMIEGGAKIINDLLEYNSEGTLLVDSLIITIGPVFLGNAGVEVSPGKHVDLKDVKWWTGVQDSVVCARVDH